MFEPELQTTTAEEMGEVFQHLRHIIGPGLVVKSLDKTYLLLAKALVNCHLRRRRLYLFLGEDPMIMRGSVASYQLP